MPGLSAGTRSGLSWTKWRRPGYGCGAKVAREETLPPLTEDEDKGERGCNLDVLPDDILLSILAMVCARARKPSDFISVRLTCRCLNLLTSLPEVLRCASPGALWPRASQWGPQVERFMWQAAGAGSSHAAYTLGMVLFYCRHDTDRVQGALLLARAAVAQHRPALYALAVILFNGSGVGRDQKNLEAGVVLCCRAAALGNENAIRELGHCLQHGYGVQREVASGRHVLCLLEINAKQLGAQAALTAVAHAALPSKPVPPHSAAALVMTHVQERRARVVAAPPVTLAERRAASGAGAGVGAGESSVRNQIHVYDVAQDTARLDRWLRSPRFEQEEACLLAGQGGGDRCQRESGLREAVSWGSFRCMVLPRQEPVAHGITIHHILTAALSAIQSAGPVEVPGGVTAGMVAQAVAWVEQLTRLNSDSLEFKSLVSRILPHQPPQPPPHPPTDAAHQVMVAHARRAATSTSGVPPRGGSTRLVEIAAELHQHHLQQQQQQQLRMCSHAACGRTETRQHEFRRCSACGAVNYCSTVCQEHHWVARHRDQCPGMAAAMAANGVMPPGVDVDEYDGGYGGPDMALTPRGGQPEVVFAVWGGGRGGQGGSYGDRRGVGGAGRS